MIFKDRQEAGEKLATLLQKKKLQPAMVVVSLLRGGIIIAEILAKKLKAPHLPLVVTKIPAPQNPELAIGALCFEIIFLEQNMIDSLRLDKSDIDKQISKARGKQKDYQQRFMVNDFDYGTLLKDKTVILTDDGVATGATMKAATIYIQSKKPKQIIIAVPIAPVDFEMPECQIVVLHRDPFLSAVSQFYEDFPQATDEEVKKILI